MAAIAVILGAWASAGLSGCAPTSQVCVSWADFSDPDAAYRQADTVVVGRVIGRDGMMETSLGPARAYRFAVERAYKGAEDSSTIRIGSRSDNCDGGGGYANGDLLANDQRVLVYAYRDGDGPVTLTPSQGVTDLPSGTPVPFGRSSSSGEAGAGTLP
ncbi:hypothetical protein [Leifsonia poae]|uniref:Uncharacterized protein n=1 Tax=Leifsonia poae TaxID=110933 RepID=A0A9W6M0D3_9MICO|nr:hypothetical protein [Leifsonia poae]GLJ76756.1 hypothetical protein GCM10017584_23300 [Leifsonia poae]